MIFCSLLAYPLDSEERRLAERCLWRLLTQLEHDDVLITYEAPFANRERALRLKPRIVGLSLAAAAKDEWVAFVDADIEFRSGFVDAVKEFVLPLSTNEPTLCATLVWAQGERSIVSEEVIEMYQRRCGLQSSWQFYFGTGLLIVNKPFLAYIDEWQILTNKSQFFPEETALVTLAHRHRERWRFVWLPDHLHFVGFRIRPELENTFAVHIGSNQKERWRKAAYGGEQ